MQSIASILEEEATFVVLFNEATHGNFKIGGYVKEQHYLYIRFGDEYMAKKWEKQLLYNHHIDESEWLDVWAKMKEMAGRILKGLPMRNLYPYEYLTLVEGKCTKPTTWADIGSAVEKGLNGE